MFGFEDWVSLWVCPSRRKYLCTCKKVLSCESAPPYISCHHQNTTHSVPNTCAARWCSWDKHSQAEQEVNKCSQFIDFLTMPSQRRLKTAQNEVFFLKNFLSATNTTKTLQNAADEHCESIHFSRKIKSDAGAFISPRHLSTSSFPPVNPVFNDNDPEWQPADLYKKQCANKEGLRPTEPKVQNLPLGSRNISDKTLLKALQRFERQRYINTQPILTYTITRSGKKVDLEQRSQMHGCSQYCIFKMSQRRLQ